jgi:S-adenosylmethionine decarboxylase
LTPTGVLRYEGGEIRVPLFEGDWRRMNNLLDDTKIKLSGFNNLTKILSFNLYDFCLAFNEKEKRQYIEFINQRYSAARIVEISRNICEIIEANILNMSQQDYDPVGASTLVLMSDLKGGGWDKDQLKTTKLNHTHPGHPHWSNQVQTPQVAMHLDKSHITAHTYPDAEDPEGICTFRVDIDIATCGEIIPLKAINYLFEAFECDVVVIDYVVRGYTRTLSGKKIFNDHTFGSIQDFIDPKVLEQFPHRSDINMPNDNIWQTKLRVNENFNPDDYLMGNAGDIGATLLEEKLGKLRGEMQEVFHLIH